METLCSELNWFALQLLPIKALAGPVLPSWPHPPSGAGAAPPGKGAQRPRDRGEPAGDPPPLTLGPGGLSQRLVLRAQHSAGGAHASAQQGEAGDESFGRKPRMPLATSGQGRRGGGGGERWAGSSKSGRKRRQTGSQRGGPRQRGVWVPGDSQRQPQGRVCLVCGAGGLAGGGGEKPARGQGWREGC